MRKCPSSTRPRSLPTQRQTNNFIHKRRRVPPAPLLLIQISVYRSGCAVKPFSCFGKKRAKRSRRKGRFVQMRPLAYPPPHRRNMYQNLAKNNLKHSKIFPKCATGGVHRGGCMPARERAPKRLPCAAFFGYFPQRTQESDTSPFASSPLNCNLNCGTILYFFR